MGGLPFLAVGGLDLRNTMPAELAVPYNKWHGCVHSTVSLQSSICARVPAAVPMATKSRWSASLRKKPPMRLGSLRRQRFLKIDESDLQRSEGTRSSIYWSGKGTHSSIYLLRQGYAQYEHTRSNLLKNRFARQPIKDIINTWQRTAITNHLLLQRTVVHTHAITETNRIQLVLFGMQNRTSASTHGSPHTCHKRNQ
jgi:hypothetical protein